MTKTKLSIFLIKEKIHDHKEIVDFEKIEITKHIDQLGVLYCRNSVPHPPAWLKTMFHDADNEESVLFSSSVSAVYICKVAVGTQNEERIFALTFGYGRTMLKMDAIEERFGLRTALNIADSNSLRKISRTSVTGNSRKTSEQLPTKSSITDFGIDIERDLLEGVTVSGKKEDLAKGAISASDSLSLSVEVDVCSLPEFLDRVYQKYCSDKYKQNFSWIDRIASVKNPALIMQLEKSAIQLINTGSENIWMAVPEIIKWEEVSGFKIQGDDNVYPDIVIEKVIDSLKRPLKEFEQLKQKRIGMLSSISETETMSWPASRCLYGELEYDGKQYCINNGNWFFIDNDYAQEVKNNYEMATISTIEFPPCGIDEKEKDYNAKLADIEPDKRALMDAKNIFFGGGSSQIELCDVLINDGRFVHVKHYSGSATLSHLFNQGLVSARLIKSEDAFRKKALDKLKETAPFFNMDLNEDCISEVVYGIISKDAEDRPNIPFFSKVAFDYARKQLQLMGVGVSIKTIHKF